MLVVFFFFECSCDHPDLHELTHSLPTRRSSDLGSRHFPRHSYAATARRTGTPWPCCAVRAAASSPRPREPGRRAGWRRRSARSEEHTSELQSLMRISYAVFCLKKKQKSRINTKQ